MKRALAILKWIPAVVCGLLVVAWVVSIVVPVGAAWEDGTAEKFIGVRLGNVEFSREIPIVQTLPDPPRQPTLKQRLIRNLGFCDWRFHDHEYFTYRVPVLIVVTTFLPAAIAPFTRFRFRLWFYFMGTAVIAAELTYYLHRAQQKLW